MLIEQTIQKYTKRHKYIKAQINEVENNGGDFAALQHFDEVILEVIADLRNIQKDKRGN